MTLVEFHKSLSEIDFEQGRNTQYLEDYLLACLAQLDVWQYKEPSYALFLLIFEQARNGPKVSFDPSWKELYGPGKEPVETELGNETEWGSLRDELRTLVTDLIHTRGVRSQADYVGKKNLFEWDTEGGVRFYNGNTPDDILGYAATRLEGEYQSRDYQENEVGWRDFSAPIWIGISYE